MFETGTIYFNPSLESSRDAPSPFVVELLDNPDDDNNLSGEGDLEVCLQCKFDVLLNWTGPFGNFSPSQDSSLAITQRRIDHLAES